MEEVIRRCDMPVKTRGEIGPHGALVESGPLTFSVENTAYTSDLCEEHRAAFAKAVAPFIESASVVSNRESTTNQAIRKALKGKKGSFTTKDVRKWLTEQGREVADSGRLPNALIDEYRSAHST